MLHSTILTANLQQAATPPREATGVVGSFIEFDLLFPQLMPIFQCEEHFQSSVVKFAQTRYFRLMDIQKALWKITEFCINTVDF